MEGLKSFHERLRDLRSQAEKLIDAGPALDALFAEEKIRLKREDGASALRAAHRTIVEQLQALKRIEISASLGHSQANLVLFPVGLAVTAIFSKNDRQSAIMDYLRRPSWDRQCPFGKVMVRVGPKGLPDDAKAISISQLARDSNRLEPEIVNGLQGNGYLLFSEDLFSSLIEKLVADVRRGKLCLPLSRERLAEIAGSNKPKSSIKIVRIE
jgi:hypothetical protein